MTEPLPSYSQQTSEPAVEEAAGLPAVAPTSDAVSGADEPRERAGSPLPALQPLAEAARAYAARKDSPNTRRAYASDWLLFERWCLRQGLDPLVPDPRIVGLFLAAAADGHGLTKVSVATLERRLAALTTRYRSAGRPLARDDRHITDVMAGIRRSHARPPRQKEAVLGEDLLAMVATLAADLRGLRDKAILLLGFAGGLRRSEIVGSIAARARRRTARAGSRSWRRVRC